MCVPIRYTLTVTNGKTDTLLLKCTKLDYVRYVGIITFSSP